MQLGERWRSGGIRTASTLCAAMVLAGCSVPSAQRAARITTTIPWAGRGTWVKADFHTQSKFTDGLNTVDEIVKAAAKYGCNAVAITDHAVYDMKAVTPERAAAIREARIANPGITVMTALEWGVPPGKGAEHATILFPSELESIDTLAPFQAEFDDYGKTGTSLDLAARGLAAIAALGENGLAPVVFFNHPSRRPTSPSAPKLTFETLKRGAPSILIGFEGAPGHQRATPLGAFDDPGILRGRWDPLAADVDGSWDQWLRSDMTVYAAIANSDFHGAEGDFWPCELAATWVYAPDTTVNSIIRAMRAGSFFAEHGHIAGEVQLEARFSGAPRPAIAGEVVSAAAGDKATISLKMNVPATDYLGRPNSIDLVELIGISKDKTTTVFSGAPGTGEAFSVAVTVPPGGIVLRARGRRNVAGELPLDFYTNPIRIVTAAP